MVAELEAEGGGAPAVATTRSSTKKAPKKSRDSIPGVKKPGRPKGKAPVEGAIAGQKSILTFLILNNCILTKTKNIPTIIKSKYLKTGVSFVVSTEEKNRGTKRVTVATRVAAFQLVKFAQLVNKNKMTTCESNEDLSRLLVPGSEWESFLSAKEYVREYCFSVKKSVMMRNRGKKQNTREAQRADRRVLRAQ